MPINALVDTIIVSTPDANIGTHHHSGPGGLGRTLTFKGNDFTLRIALSDLPDELIDRIIEGIKVWSEVDPDFGTRGLIGKAAVPLLNGAGDDEANETDD